MSTVTEPTDTRNTDAQKQLISICCSCGRELRRRPDPRGGISHGLCENCRYKLYPNLPIQACLIPLGDGSSHAFVSREDWTTVRNFAWHLDCQGYPASKRNGNKIRMHTLIMNPPQGLVVDHINRDQLDNRRENLRIVHQVTNVRNHGLARRNTSGFSGVSSANAKNSAWRAYITVENRQIHLGTFSKKKEAWFARLNAEMKYWKMTIQICAKCLRVLSRYPSGDPKIKYGVCHNCEVLYPDVVRKLNQDPGDGGAPGQGGLHGSQR